MKSTILLIFNNTRLWLTYLHLYNNCLNSCYSLDPVEFMDQLQCFLFFRYTKPSKTANQCFTGNMYGNWCNWYTELFFLALQRYYNTSEIKWVVKYKHHTVGTVPKSKQYHYHAKMINWLINWCLTPILAVLQLYGGVNKFNNLRQQQDP